MIGIAVLTLIASRETTKAAQRAGGLTLVILVLLAGILAVWPEKTEFVNLIAVRTYGLAQIAASVLITLTAIEVVILAACRKITIAGAMARLAFAYLPLAMLSALGSCIWAVTLNVVVRLRHPASLDPNWQIMFVGNLGYDLKSVEWAMAGATAALGFFVIVATVKYYFTDPAKQGRAAHVAIYVALILTPLLLAVPGGLLALTSPYFGQVLPATPWQNVLRIYTVSALRIVPWLLAAVTPVATLLDVLADVVFYITDRDLRFSSFNVCNKRLSMLLRYAQSRYPWIRIVAHSQGSVIAHTTLLELQKDVPIALTTIGSPLGSLYKKYLGWDVERLPMWRNLFRSGDYIGGPVCIEDVDKNIGSGGHTGYWQDPRLLKWLGEPVSDI